MTYLSELLPWWLRPWSWMLPFGNDGLSWPERKYLARRYRRQMDRLPSPERIRAGRAYLEAKRAKEDSDD